MRKFMSKIALVLIPVFMLGSSFGCQPEKVDTAKRVMDQASFYIDLAGALITVAETKYSDNPKVGKALTATKISLETLNKSLIAIKAGISEDYEALKAAVVELAVQVFVLIEAIDEAKSASSSS